VQFWARNVQTLDGPNRGEQVQNHSCSDKIAKWGVVGGSSQGACDLAFLEVHRDRKKKYRWGFNMALVRIVGRVLKSEVQGKARYHPSGSGTGSFPSGTLNEISTAGAFDLRYRHFLACHGIVMPLVRGHCSPHHEVRSTGVELGGAHCSAPESA
jgi:hypothetical protein